MNATIESSRGDASGGLALHLISAVGGMALALSLALLSGAWESEPSRPEPPRRSPIPLSYRFSPQPPETPVATIYILRSDIEASVLTSSISSAASIFQITSLEMMPYSVLVSPTAEDDAEIDRVVAEHARQYSENGLALNVVDMRYR